MVAVQCSDPSVFMHYCKSWLSEWETFRWLSCGYVTVYAVFIFIFFHQSAHPEVVVSWDVFVYILSAEAWL